MRLGLLISGLVAVLLGLAIQTRVKWHNTMIYWPEVLMGLNFGSEFTTDDVNLVLAAASGSIRGHVLPNHFNGIRGLQCTKYLVKGTTVLSVARSHTLSVITQENSAEAASLVSSWAKQEDGDTFLEVAALMYEVAVRGPASLWRPYFKSLPAHYNLPVNFSSSSRCHHLLSQLPELARLVAKRQAALQTFRPLVKSFLLSMPGGRKALGSWSDADLWNAYLWAYSTARTRSVSVDVPEHHPLASWAPEVGALVPVLDLANHAHPDEATTELRVSEDKVQLVAVRDMKAGDQVTFSYVEEEEPMCGHRWLLEYGFVPNDHGKRRACMVWWLEAEDLKEALMSTRSACGISAADFEAALRAVDRAKGVRVEVNAAGTGADGLLEELEKVVGAGHSVWAAQLGKSLMLARSQRLEAAAADLKEAALLDGEGSCLGAAELLEVAYGAAQALRVVLQSI